MSGLAAFEDYLRARQSMYLQLYFHKTSVAAEAMMQNLAGLLGGWSLPIDLNEYINVDEYNIDRHISEVANSRLATDEAKKSFARHMADLFTDRIIWKRVFEVTSNDTSTAISATKRACDLISAMGYRFEVVMSSNSLTRFRPREENEHSRNYLRLIKKDDSQFPRVLPIEDHSRIVSDNQTVQISRVYVQSGHDENGNNIIHQVKKALSNAMNSV